MIKEINTNPSPDKIYRRKTQRSGAVKKKKNEKNRKRNVFLNFRVTPVERELIEKRIELSGLTKSRFFIESCLYQTILVKGNVNTFSKLQKEMDAIAEKLTTGSNLGELDPETIQSIRIILEILEKQQKNIRKKD